MKTFDQLRGSTMDLEDSIPISLAVTTTLVAVILAVVMVRRFHGRKRYHPVGGSIFQQRSNMNRIQDYRTELARKHKTYRFPGFLGSFSQVLTVDPANVEYILKTNFANYGQRWDDDITLMDLLGEGFFNVNGEKWQHQRKLTSYEFSTKTLREYSNVVSKTNAIKLARILAEAASSNRSFDIQDLFVKAALDSTFKVILGVELDVMCGTFEEGTRFSEALNAAKSLISYRLVGVFWKTKRYLNIGSEALLKKSIKEVDEFVYKIIQSRIEQMQNSHEDLPKKKEDILSRFLEAKQTDKKYLRDIILNLVLAGQDTTSSTLSFFFYMMCKHPDIQEKIARQVIEATQVNHNNSSIDEVAANITETTLDKMQYLHAALTETLRLYPPLPADGKTCFSDDTLPDGFRVDKRDLVLYLPYAMGRMEFLWGDDAEEFRPDRWLGESGRFHQESPFKFTAFQAGPRICLGKEFAYRQMKIFCMILLSSYEFKLSYENKPLQYNSRLTLIFDGGLHILATPRVIQV